jgi:hypothetical protein
MIRTYLSVALLALCVTPAIAQNRITPFTVSNDRGDGTLVTTVSWGTEPTAQSCTATGYAAWAGPKAPSGSETFTIAESGGHAFNLSCVWPGDSIVTYEWTPATQNTDGSPYVDRKNTVIVRTFDAAFDFANIDPVATCASPPAGVGCATLDDAASPRPSVHTVTGITQTGTLRSSAYHVNQQDAWSAASNVATKLFTGVVTVADSVGVTVDPVPRALSGFTAR